MEDLRTAIKLLSSNNWTASIDLKDIHLLVPLHKRVGDPFVSGLKTKHLSLLAWFLVYL